MFADDDEDVILLGDDDLTYAEREYEAHARLMDWSHPGPDDWADPLIWEVYGWGRVVESQKS